MSEASEQIRSSFAAGDDARDEGLTAPEDVERYTDILYGDDPDWQLLDVYRPKDKAGEKLPVIFSVHGGGWEYGDKERYQYYCMSLAELGFAVVNFTYRLAPEFQFPAPLEDTNLVVAWILEHADEYGMDTDHIFGVGDSAGGNDLGLYAAICTNPDYAANFPFTVPEGFRLSAVALNCGAYGYQREGLDELSVAVMDDYLPGGAVQEEMDKIYVPYYVTDNYVPTCIMTCTGDFLKGYAPLMYDKLMECDVPFEFLYFGDKDHELGHVFHLNMKLDIAHECNQAECEFFRRFM